jgi:aminopeptidase-like protein
VEFDILNNGSLRIASYPEQNIVAIGQEMYKLAERLFPICRSITGAGVRETLHILQEIVPQMTIHEVPSGTQVFDWTVPKEWNIRDAYIEDLDGNRVISFSDSNLHVLGYSAPIDKIVTRYELLDMIYTLPEQPEVIPYVTSYYKEQSGFCMSENQKQELVKEKYHVFIDSELKDGSLTYGEVLIPGETSKEVFLSTYVCHPSMANNELSGLCIAINLAKWLLELITHPPSDLITRSLKQFSPLRFSYRVIFIPETIGAITYLSRNLDKMKRNIITGFVITCVGDDRAYSYLPSRYGDTLADRVAKNSLRFHAPYYKSYSFLERGSDERQYCAPGVDLPVCSIMRSKYGEYPEYHTSADNLDIISPQGLSGAFELYRKCLEALEWNYTYRLKCLGEPQLGKRGLYPAILQSEQYNGILSMSNFIAYADGTNDLIAISDIIGVPVNELISIAKTLEAAGLIEVI